MVRFLSKRYPPSEGLMRISPFDVAPMQEHGRRSYDASRLPSSHAQYFGRQIILWAEQRFCQTPSNFELVVSKKLIIPGRQLTELAFSNRHFERPYRASGATHVLVTVADWEGEDFLPLGTNIWEGPVSFVNDQAIDVEEASLYKARRGEAICIDSRTVHSAPNPEHIDLSEPITRVMVSGVVALPKPVL